jgi:hypothetical protein
LKIDLQGKIGVKETQINELGVKNEKLEVKVKEQSDMIA